MVGDLLDVHDLHFGGTAPSGRDEDFHGVHLIFAATVPDDARPEVVESGGTTDAVAWVPLAEITAGDWPVLELVTHALAFSRDRPRSRTPGARREHAVSTR